MISSDKAAQKLAAKPNYDCCTIFDENLIAIHMKKTKLYFNKPFCLCMSILDLSKSLMYDFHYNYIKTKFRDKAKLLFIETDSLASEIKNKDFYNDINPDIEKRFDTSDYTTNHSSWIKTGLNSKVLGMFKDEADGKQIVEFVGFRANLFCYKMLDGSEDKKCKRWQRMLQRGVLNSMTTESVCLAGKNNTVKWMSYEIYHEIYTEETNKIAVTSDDDKRGIIADGIHTLAYGHTNFKNCN